MPTLTELVAEELAVPVDPRVADLAEVIADQHGRASRAVLFYGSCLREQKLDGLMLDFYLIVNDYRAAYDRRWLALANRMLPPNVFHVARNGLRAKYAVLSESDFRRLNRVETVSVSVWARFAQPTRLVWAADAKARQAAIESVAEAAASLLAAARSVVPDTGEPLDLWRGAFALTYAAELRAERSGRAKSVVDQDLERYRRFTEPALKAAAKFKGPLPSWRRRKVAGKLLSVVRLAKASATFQGGADYIAWKINRHAGTDIRLKPWQRRWPMLAALSLLPRLLRSGSVR